MKKNKTISKNFFDDQILGVSIDEEGRKVIHLKMGVRKQYNSGYLDYDECYQRNEVLDIQAKYKKINILLFGNSDLDESYD